MLLPLLGACVVVGPFQGPEWEPVQDLLSQNCSCRDPRCCSNLLVLCLFLIWQVRHYWHQVTRTHPSMRNVIKVPVQTWAVPSMRRKTFFRLTPEFFSIPGEFRVLDAHVQQWAQKQRWEYRRRFKESWAQHRLSLKRPCQGSPESVHTLSEPIFCTTSFSSTCLLSQDSSWEAQQCPSDGQTHPALDMCQRMKQLLVHSQEKLVPLEPVASMRSHPTCMILSTPLSILPSAQRLQFCPREFLPDSSNQQLRMPTWTSWDCLQEAWVLGSEKQIVGREDTREIQDPGCVNQRERREEDAWKIQASSGQLPIDFGLGDDAETKVLNCGNQRLAISETDGEILTSGWENQNQMGVEHRAKIQELQKRNQREVGGKNPPETQAHMGENQEQLKSKIDAQTQTTEWGDQDKSGGEDAVEIQTFERKNKKEDRGEDEGEIQAQGLEKQDQTGGGNDEESQMSKWGKQDQIRDDTGADSQTEEGRIKNQVGGEDAVQTQTSGTEDLGEVKKEDVVDTQALEWGKWQCLGSENVTEIWTPGWEKQDQGGSKKAGETHISRGENHKLLRYKIQVGRKKLREIKEEDWVVIQAPWWGNQQLIASEIDRKFQILYWGTPNQIGGEHRAEIQALEKRDQRKDRDKDGTNTLVPEAETQGQLRGETEAEAHSAGRKNKEQFGDENGTDIQALGKRNPRGAKGEDGKKIQELGEENQSQLGNELNEKIHIPKWKNQEHIRAKDGANTQASKAENWGELTSKIDGETHSAGWKKEEQVGGENGAEIQIQGKKNLREAGSEDGTEIQTPGGENQSHLRCDIDRKTHLSEWKNQEQMGGENRTEIQAPEKGNQREPGGEEGVKTQRPERENQGQCNSKIGGGHSSGRRNWEQTGGENITENQISEKRNQGEAGSEDGREIQRLLKSNAKRKTYSSECKSLEQIGGGNGEEIQIQGKRNLSGTTGDDGTETQTAGEDDQGQLKSEIDGDIQTQGQGNQNKGGDENAAEIRDAGSQRKCRTEDAGQPRAPRGGNKDQVRGKDAARANFQVDCRSEVLRERKHRLAQPPALTGYGYGVMEQKQAVVGNGLAPALCAKMEPLPHQGEVFLLAGGEEEHLASQGTALVREHRVGVCPASQQAWPETQRRQQRDKGVDPGKASNLIWQLQNPQPLATPLGIPSACLSLLCGQTPQAATALVGVPAILTAPLKWPVLKKSKRLLLESLMRRRIAHLKWGLPRRVLESYLLFNILGSCSLPLAGVRFPGLYTGQELQGQQERHCEAQGFTPGFKSPERSRRVRSPQRKSSKHPTQARALEKYRPCRSDPMCISIPPEKPRRIRPPGGAREPQAIQEEVPRAKLPAPRNPTPATESRSWCSRERAKELYSENSRGRQMVGPGVSQTVERSPSRVRMSSSRAGQNCWKKERTSWEACKPPRLKCQHPTYWRRGSLEPAEGRGAGEQPSSCSTEDTSNFKGSLHSATAKLSMTFPDKMSWSPQLATPRHLAPNLSLRDPDPILFPKVGDPHAGEDSIGVHTSLERDLQPPGQCCAGATLPRTESLQCQGAPGNSNGAPQNSPARQKFGFMKQLRCFLFRRGFKK
ncbi:uncharacterized protein LOC134391609 [Cynocephalus volans]|uniref:uncharacterized protein LOC134391609 n=1 Tax=Cynocephalus volans TaxID=110931 RepID=UPI002FCB6047